MSAKIRTLKDLRLYLSNALTGLYDEREQKVMFFIIIRAVLSSDNLHVLYDMNTAVSETESSKIFEIIDELKQGKPIQYILGETEFYGCRITLSPATLIPRQETEELVDIIIKENAGYNGQIIDIGTGSGCIAISRAKNMSGASIFGTDFSAEAIDIAKYNAEINNVKINFIHEDIFNPAEIFSINAGIIVSNPPYVMNSEKTLMHRNVLDYEPASALFVDDAKPLIFYEAILKIAVKILQTNGKIYFEINEALGNEMRNLLKQFDYSGIDLIKDINGKNRFIKGTKNGI
jgi:release factor glutamine methyltransferase